MEKCKDEDIRFVVKYVTAIHEQQCDVVTDPNRFFTESNNLNRYHFDGSLFTNKSNIIEMEKDIIEYGQNSLCSIEHIVQNQARISVETILFSRDYNNNNYNGANTDRNNNANSCKNKANIENEDSDNGYMPFVDQNHFIEFGNKEKDLLMNNFTDF